MTVHYCGCDVQIQSVITVSDEEDPERNLDERALAWEALYVPSTPDVRDPNQAPTELAPSHPTEAQGEAQSIPVTPHYDLDQGDFSPADEARGEATRIVAKEAHDSNTTSYFPAHPGIS